MDSTQMASEEKQSAQVAEEVHPNNSLKQRMAKLAMAGGVRL